MSTNLYETLGLRTDATPKQIREAYLTKARKTHPDRLPQGASPAQKDMFRLVKDAYEVLGNPENRRLYDQHGIWPPPTAHETDTQGNWQGPARDPSKLEAPPFRKPSPHHPFFDRPRKKDPLDFSAPSSSHSHFHRFTDPFVLFDQIFGDLHHAFSRVPFGDSFSDLDDDFFRGGFKSPTSVFRTESSPFGFPIGGNSNVNVSSRGRPSGGPSGGSKRISKGYSTSNVNGVTYTKVSRKDSEGNEHVTYSYPDGTKRRLINGIEQPESLSGRKIFKASWS